MADRIVRSLILVTTVVSTAMLLASASAQNTIFYQPLNQRTPLGHTAGWLTHIRGHQSTWLQPVQIQVSGGAEVSVYSGTAEPLRITSSPGTVAVNPGHTYRLRLANMPEFPGVELYPSIEVLDRLHPPAGEEYRYPIPIPFSDDDIRLALADRLVTRVIYLEPPQLAQQTDPLNREIPQAVLPSENVLQEADRLGRPMVIVRIGGRSPSRFRTSSIFSGTGGAVQLQGDEDRSQRPRQIPSTALRVR